MAKKQNSYDQYTIRYDNINLEKNWGKISSEVFEAVLDLKTDGRCAIKGMLRLLYDDSLDHKVVLKESKYRYMIRCSQSTLAKLIDMDKSHLSKGIKQLIDAKLVVKEDDIFYINPLLFNDNWIVDTRTLDKFGITYSSSKITRKKHDPNNLTSGLVF